MDRSASPVALRPMNQVARAARVAPVLNPARVRSARELLGLTQGQVAERAGLSTATISNLEAGKSRPTAANLAALAEATDFPVEYFAHHRGDGDFEGFFRSLRSSPLRDRRRATAWAHLVHDLAGALETEVRLPQVAIPELPTNEDTSWEEIEAIAGEVRRQWGVEPGPIGHVVALIERHGPVAAALPLDRLDLDAFSIWFSDRPVIVLGRDKRVAARSRFDAAHELGHLVMHGQEHVGTRLAEKQAHQFAAAFLMPAEEIRDELPRQASWPVLMQLKVTWKASLQALLMRAKTLGVMTEARYVQAMKQVSARGWRKDEPGDDQLGPPELPQLLEAAVGQLASRGTSLEELAMRQGLPLGHLNEILDESLDRRPTVEF